MTNRFWRLGGFLALGLLASAAEGAEGRSGEDVFRTVCIECHGSGKHGAPRAGNRKAWRPLIREGLDDLARTAIKGIRKMPPRGGKPDLTDLEVRRAVVYMANQAGAGFVEP